MIDFPYRRRSLATVSRVETEPRSGVTKLHVCRALQHVSWPVEEVSAGAFYRDECATERGCCLWPVTAPVPHR